MRKAWKTALALTALLAAGGTALAQAGPVQTTGPRGKLKEVMDRGVLRCASHNGSIPGFAEITDTGNWKGFDIEMCRTMAVAIFGTDKDHIQFLPTSWAQRWPMLQSGELDVLIKQTGVTESRDTELGLAFSRPYILGTFQVLARKELGTSIADLDGGTMCAPAGSTNERAIANFAQAQKLKIKIVTYDKWEEMVSSYYDNRCDGIVSTGVSLPLTKRSAPNPDQHVLLKDILALEAQAWVVKAGDKRWLDVANWILSALWYAEERGITRANVDTVRANPPSPEVAKFLGLTPGVGSRLGLSDSWAFNVIKAHGNYGEIWSRNIGAESSFKLDRGPNALWTGGGTHYSLNFD